MGSGLYMQSVGGKNVLKYNGKAIDSVVKNLDHSFGLYVNGKELDIDGLAIACSSKLGDVRAVGEGVRFNEVELVDSLECVNITMQDYTNLRNGQAVPGYKRYNPQTIYNIVADVSQASKISYTIANGVVTFGGQTSAPKTNDMVYNSVDGGLTENTIDNVRTITDINCPFVNVRYFDPIVAPNGTIDIFYYVDDRYLSSLKHGLFGKTFTVIIKTEQGSVSKQTTYAGEFKLTTPQFTQTGETWFSIEVIDSNGVGSAVQFYDVLVRNAVQDNFYTMVEADLTTYGIVPNDSDPIKSYDNKKGFRDLFNAVKDGSHNGTIYNGIVLLNRTYWINYHKDFDNGNHDFGTQRYFKVGVSSKKITSVEEVSESYVKGVFPNIESINRKQGTGTFRFSNVPSVGGSFDIQDGTRYIVINPAHDAGDQITIPDDFTVDFNGSTLKAIPSTDVFKGCFVLLDGNFNTHLKNGKLVGNYQNYDFYNSLIRQGVETAAEGLTLVTVIGCKYCSFDNIEISWSMGYAGPFGGHYNNGSDNPLTTNTSHKMVDISTGEVISADNMVAIEYKTNGNKLNVQGVNEFCFGRYGYGGYAMGQERELFYSFYDGNDEYIKTIKSKCYYLCKVPSNAVYLKITGYGSESDFPMSTGNGGLSVFHNPAVSKDVVINNCTWHDTRTCAINPTIIKGLKYKDCYFTNIATKSGFQGVTSMLGDFEDGWQWTTKVLFDGCVCEQGTGPKPYLLIHFCQGLNFKNCDGIVLDNSGGVENGFVEHNKFSECRIGISNKSLNPFVIYNDNEIDTLKITYNPAPGATNIGAIDQVVAMEDTTIKNKCLYQKLILTGDSINGIRK